VRLVVGFRVDAGSGRSNRNLLHFVERDFIRAPVVELGYGGAAYGQDLMYAGWWNNDTNPITGFELVGNSSTIKAGTCSLYGMK
jgi:hypothetical protein